MEQSADSHNQSPSRQLVTGENRTILHMDLDSFFVSVSRLMHPELVGKPVLVGGSSDRGVVAACSYEARAFGIHSAMPMKLAKRLCPHALVVRGDYEEYSKRSDEVTQIIKEKVPLFERASIDEFYVDFTGMDKFFGCYQYATELRKSIIHETGLPISFGMSANKTVSKVATDEAKPNNQLKIDFGNEKAFLAPLSIKKIPMVGEKTYSLLRSMGIEKVHTVQKMPMELLQNVLGENGGLIWRKANGIDNTPVEPYNERKSISCEETFEKDTIDVNMLHALLIKMVEKIAFQLRSENKLTACVTVKIRYSNFDTHTMQARIPHSSSDHVLIAQVKELFQKLYNRRLLIRLIGVRFSHLVGGGHQINLFEDSTQIINLYQAMDKMRILFGAKAVQRAIGLSSSMRSFNPFNGISSSPEKERKADFEYQLVLHPPVYIRNEIEKEKQHLARQYKFPRAQKLPAHLLLARFFLNEEKEEELVNRLRELCVMQPTFNIEFNHFAFFPDQSIAIATRSKQNLIQFIRVLKQKLDPPPSASAFYFQAHIPIATQLTTQVFRVVEEQYARRTFNHSFIAQKISLLRRKEQLDTPIELGEFEFTATASEGL